MPLEPGEDVGDSLDELKHGKTFARTAKKFGKKKARKQSIAIAMKNKRKDASKRARK